MVTSSYGASTVEGASPLATNLHSPLTLSKNRAFVVVLPTSVAKMYRISSLGFRSFETASSLSFHIRTRSLRLFPCEHLKAYSKTYADSSEQRHINMRQTCFI